MLTAVYKSEWTDIARIQSFTGMAHFPISGDAHAKSRDYHRDRREYSGIICSFMRERLLNAVIHNTELRERKDLHFALISTKNGFPHTSCSEVWDPDSRYCHPDIFRRGSSHCYIKEEVFTSPRNDHDKKHFPIASENTATIIPAITSTP